MDEILSKKIISELAAKEKGYSLALKLSHDELNVIKNLISEQWLTVINRFFPQLTDVFKNLTIENYHQMSHLLPHQTLWPKSSRTLPHQATIHIRTLPFIKKLQSIFDNFAISNEDNVESEEIYWRLVRPNEPLDVGPMHADCWFWDLGHGVTPQNCQRVKIWIPIVCEPGLNGLNLVPGSHVRDWTYSGEIRDGYLKPQFDQSQVDLPVILPKTNPGEAIIFNDRLLHKGVLNNGSCTRVSMEFTLFVDKNLMNRFGE